jgi:hypothetical protein
MKRSFFISLVVVSAFLISSCNSNSEPGTNMLPNVGGSSGEIAVVMEKAKWDGQMGDKVREILASPVEGLPQTEPIFDLLNATPGVFGELYITHRNILFIEIGEGKEAKATFSSNVYAKSQLIITLQGETEDDIIQLLDTQGKTIADKINITERDRRISYYKQSVSSINFNTLRDGHKINLYVPGSYSLDVNEKSFVWLAYETPLTTQSILVHYFDYKGENYFNEDSIRSIRNNMTRAKVEGPVEGTWMVIEDKFPVVYNTFRFRDRNYAEMRGLWTLENGYMGGPFITLVTKDEVNNRFVMIDGFVYAPKGDKRELMRQVEAILYTVGFDLGSEEK